MLGYVKIDKGELKVREYEVYCGYYCGICKSIGKRYGQLPRMALSYDAAFLAILLASLNEASDEPLQEHCVVHHIKKKTIIYNKAVDYAGDVMLILAWYKLLDDINDEGKSYAKATALMLKGIFKKLYISYPDLCDGIEKNLKELSYLEQSKCDSIDMAAESFSKIMEVIFSEGVKKLYPEVLSDKDNSNESSSDKDTFNEDIPPFDTLHDNLFHETTLSNLPDKVKQIGYHMGKWIYLIDAVDDIEDNIKTGSYNPLLYRFGYDASKESPTEFRNRIEDDLRFNLFHYLAVTCNCIASLDIKKNQGIIDNIIYFGLNRKTEEIITGVEEKNRI